MDQFAQSRGDDDLFDDEIIPIEAPSEQLEHTHIEEKPVTDPVTTSTTVVASEPVESSTPTRGRGSGRGRGRGRGVLSRDASHPGLSDSKFAPKPRPAQKDREKQIAPSEDIKQDQARDQTGDADQSQEAKDTEHDVDKSTNGNIPTGPSSQVPPKTPAVRGNRLNTGGLQRPKLTEEELNAKLAAAKERNQNRAAAYAREQADAENFAERERVASQNRVKENAERKALEGEREKNRARKLRGQQGREWDARKNESDFSGRGRGDRRRWVGTEDEDNDLSMYEWNEDRGRGRGRGRGGRGSRGRGRGDLRGQHHDSNRSQPALSNETDFPALPGAGETSSGKKTESVTKPVEVFDTTVEGSWAEQVEAGEANR